MIKPGQAVPRGLHYRMNFETGIQEAKLLVDDKKKTGGGKERLDMSSVVTTPPACEEEEESTDGKSKYTKNGKKESCAKKKATPAASKGPKIVISEKIKPEERSEDKIYVTKDQIKDALHQFRDKVCSSNSPQISRSDSICPPST